MIVFKKLLRTIQRDTLLYIVLNPDYRGLQRRHVVLVGFKYKNSNLKGVSVRFENLILEEKMLTF